MSLNCLASSGADTLELSLPRRLHSPNATRGYHWRVRHRDTQTWERLIASCSPALWQPWVLPIVGTRIQGRLLVPRRTPARRVLTVERQVPSRRNFIHDLDNLTFSAKPLADSLRRLGLLYDDSTRWLDLRPVRQTVHPDGQDWTILTLERADDERTD